MGLNNIPAWFGKIRARFLAAPRRVRQVQIVTGIIGCSSAIMLYSSLDQASGQQDTRSSSTMADSSSTAPTAKKQNQQDDRICNDSVHGFITLPSICYRIINTPQFQRLRNIKQLGGVYYVYPGASLNRFEHSMGVCHLAGKLVKKLQGSQPELNITDEDVLCIQIAGLCHDLGHGPLSHLFDEYVIQELGKQDPPKPDDSKWTHEEASSMLFDYMLNPESGNKELIQEFEDVFTKDLSDTLEGEDRIRKVEERIRKVKRRIKKLIKPPKVSRMQFEYQIEDASGNRLLSKEFELTFVFIPKVERRKSIVEDRIKELYKPLPSEDDQYMVVKYQLKDEISKEIGLVTELSNEIKLTDPDTHEVKDKICEVQGRIEELIKPLVEYGNPQKKKKFLYEIVANEITKIDVDKWDYFMRDCHHLGLKNAFDHRRLIKSARVIDDKLCFRNKEVRNVYEMFHTRETLHRQAYQHKTTLIIQHMIAEALRHACDSTALKIENKTLRESIRDPVAYTSLDDTVLWLILNPRSKAEEECEELKKARAILQKVQRREQPRFICSVKDEDDFWSSNEEKNKLQEKMKAELDSPGLVIELAKFDYGSKAKNPLHAVRFYSKFDSNKVIRGKELEDQVPLMIPSKFKETVLYFYSDIDDTDERKHIDSTKIKEIVEREVSAERRKRRAATEMTVPEKKMRKEESS